MTDLGMVSRPRAIQTGTRLKVRRSTLVMILFTIYLIGAHLRLSLYSGSSILLPMYPMLLSAAVMTLLFMNQLLTRAGALFAIFAGFILIYPLLTTAPGSEYRSTLLGSLQFLVSVISALALIQALSSLDPQRLRRLVLWIWCIMITLATLEALGLKPVFDAVRDVLYSGSGRGVYEATQRDIGIYGRVRTTVFASEPSFLADTLASLILLVFFLDPKRGSIASWARLGGMLALSFLLSPSFKMAFYVLAAVVWQFWPRNLRGLTSLIAGLAVAGVLLAVFYGPILGFFLETVGGHLESGSFYGRIGVAHSVGFEALRNYPLFGYGLSNQDGLYPIIAQVWQSSGAFALFPWYQPLPAQGLMSNGFWWEWAYLGIAGGLIVTLLMTSLLRRIGVELPLRTVVCTWIVWYAGAAFVDPRSWYMIALFAVGAVQFAGTRAAAQDKKDTA